MRDDDGWHQPVHSSLLHGKHRRVILDYINQVLADIMKTRARCDTQIQPVLQIWLVLLCFLAFGGSTNASELNIAAPGPQGPLKGSYLEANASPAALVLIIPGSGPIDRDGNGPGGWRTDMYKLLAEGLSQRGISSIRIDKRGMFASRQAIDDPNDVAIGTYADDVHAWMDVAKAMTGSKCVWLLGHSEGALVSLKAAQAATDLCGLLLVAAPGRPIGTLLREQLQSNPGNAAVLEEAMSIIDSLEAGRKTGTDTMHHALQPLFSEGLQRYMIDLFSHDPSALASTYDGPTLILQGSRDLQVKMRDAERLMAALPNGQLKVLQDMNHVLKKVESDDLTANFATYSNPAHALAPGITAAVTDFIGRHGATARKD